MTGDEAYVLLVALLDDGDDLNQFVRSFDVDEATAPDVAALIKTLREERNHLRNQLAAAREQVEIIAAKRAYGVNPWLHPDIQTLRRLLAEHP